MSMRTKLRGNWLVTIPLVGLTVCYLVLFDAPARRHARQVRSELAASMAQVAQGPSILMQISQLEEQLSRSKAHVAAWEESSPPTSGSAVLLGQISRLARDAGARTARLEPGSPAEHDSLRSLALTLVCTGEFEQIFEMLRGIEALPQSVWIDDLKIERKQANDEGLQCELKLAVFAGKSEISN